MSAKKAVITHEIASISLSKDGKVVIEMELDDFKRRVLSTFGVFKPDPTPWLILYRYFGKLEVLHEQLLKPEPTPWHYRYYYYDWLKVLQELLRPDPVPSNVLQKLISWKLDITGSYDDYGKYTGINPQEFVTLVDAGIVSFNSLPINEQNHATKVVDAIRNQYAVVK